MSWKLSVCDDFIPPQTQGTEQTLALTSSMAVNATVIPTSSGSLFMKGDIITLGPSSNVTNVGATEQVTVVSVSSGNITIEVGISYAYASGDQVYGVGSALAQGWIIDSVKANGNNVVTPLGVHQKSNSNYVILDGVGGADFVAQYFSAATGSSGSFGKIYKRKLNRKPIAQLEHRIGCYYRMPSGSGTIEAGVMSSAGTGYIAGANLSTVVSAWTKVETVQLGIYDTMGEEWHYFLRFDINCSTPLFGIDCPYVTHALLTSGQSYGVYSLPNPSYVSPMIDEPGYRNKSRYSIYNNSLNSLKLRGYDLTFEDADELLLKNLEVLTYWQNSGYTLMFESDIAGERPIFGYLDYDMRFVSWDDTLTQVTLQFRGI